MSKSTSKKEANLKAGVKELIEPLLKRISSSRCGPENQESVERLSRLVKATRGLIEERQNCKCELITFFGKMERDIDLWEEDHYSKEEISKREDTWGVLMANLEALLVKHGVHDHGSHEGLERDNSPPQIGTKFELGESSNNNKYQENDWNDDRFREWIIRMGDRNIRVVFCLAIFPQDIVLKKRQLINWWVGLNLFYYEYLDMDNLINSLIDEGILVPVHAKKHNQVTDIWTINPTFHRLLNRVHYFKIKPYRNKYSEMLIHLFGWHLTAVLNRDQQYLYSLDLKEFLENDSNPDLNYGDSVKIVQLGKWGGTDLKSQDHIEVDDTDFLNYLAKSTTYLGLQGISRIEKLPKSIGNLPNLKILDLRACHNLDKLPEKPQSKRARVTWFSNLVYLDISECYLLDHMPKWISELYRLKVLKGFVASNVSKKEQSCQLRDLVKLHNLRKLSIRIAKHLILNPVDASALKSMKLSILTVTWGIKHNNENERDKVQTISFPTTLEKLDLRCYPKAEATELKLADLPELKRLYVRGGKLTKIETDSPWEVLEVLRLRFLNNLEMDWSELLAKFTRLKHVEYEQCPLLKHFPKDRNTWNMKEYRSFSSGSDAE